MSRSSVRTKTPVKAIPVSSTPDFWQKVITFFFHFMVITVPLFFLWISEEVFEFNKISLTYFCTIMIVAAWVIRMIVQKKLIFRRTPFDWPILFFLISQTISTILSVHPRTSIFGYYTRFNGGLLSLFTYTLLFYAFVSNIEKKQIKSFLSSIFISAFVVSLYAIPEHFGHSFSCILIHGSNERSVWDMINPAIIWKNYDVTCWVQEVQLRVFASFGQPNWLAAYDVTLIPIGIVLFVEEGRIFYLLNVIGLFLSLIFTKSRSGILAFATGILFLFVLGRKTLSSSAHRQRLGLLCGLLLVCALGFGTPYTPAIDQLWHSSTSSAMVSPSPEPESAASVAQLDLGGTDSGEIRKIVWRGALKVWLRYPIFGSGVETFGYTYYKDRPVEHNLVSEWDFVYNKAHNEFLNFLATTGIVGLSTYLLLLGSFVFVPVLVFFNRRVPYTDQLAKKLPDAPSSLLPLSYSAGIVALSVSNFFGFSTVMVNILMFLLPAAFLVEYLEPRFIQIGNQNQQTKPAFAPARAFTPASTRVSAQQSQDYFSEKFSEKQVAGFVLTFILVVLLLYSLITMWLADFYYAHGKSLVLEGYAGAGILSLQRAVTFSPNEAYFYDDLSSTYASSAVFLAEQGQATDSAQLANLAYETSHTMIDLNPVNLNNYKTQFRVMMMLAQLQPKLLQESRDTMLKARELAPTDPRIVYNLGLTSMDLKNDPQAIQEFEESVALKPDFEAGRLALGEEYEKVGRFADAKAQFQYILEKIQPKNDEARQHLENIEASESAQAKSPSKTKTPARSSK